MKKMKKTRGKRTGKTKPRGLSQEVRYTRKNKSFRLIKQRKFDVCKKLKRNRKMDLDKLRQKPDGPHNPHNLSNWSRTKTKQKSLEETL